MHGQTIVITGATSGIGQVAALALAKQGARVVFVARSAAKADAMLGALKRANPDAAHDWVLADLTTIAAMRAAGEALAAKAPRIDVLVNNAGAIFDHREITADGLEMTFAVNHMAYFVITEGLRPYLNPTGARIVSTSSIGHQFGKLDFNDLQSARGYSAMGAYGRSKLCNIVWTRELSRRLEGTGVTANCFHPGGVNTGFGHNTTGLIKVLVGLAGRFMITPEQGADTLIWLAEAPEVAGQTGGYWFKRKLTQPSAAARDPVAGAKLWAESERIVQAASAVTA